MPCIEIRQLNKSYGAAAALRKLDLRIESGEFLTLLGPAGSGKTTLLRILAGIETPDSGEVLFDGKNARNLSPLQRNVARVNHEPDVFPHLNVAEHIALGLSAFRLNDREKQQRILKSAQALDIANQLGELPAALSGNQQLRTAIARAMVKLPGLVLYDEPLSLPGLQGGFRLLNDIRKLHRRFPATTLFATSSPDEARSLNVRTVILRAGQTEQSGTFAELYQEPANQFVASYLGERSINLVYGQLLRSEGLFFHNENFMIALPDAIAERLPEQLREVVMGFHPDALCEARHEGGKHYSQPQHLLIKQVEREGPGAYLQLHSQREKLWMKVERQSNKLHSGEPISVCLELSRLFFFDPETERRLV